MEDCIFCKIIKGRLESTKVYEDQNVIGFHDINPLAKKHLLFIHKKHTKNVLEILSEDQRDLLDIYQAINSFI